MARSASGRATGGRVRKRRTPAPGPATDESSAGRVSAVRDKLVRGVLSPVNAVLLTRRHIEEVLDDAVARGRMTRADAQDMAQTWSRAAPAQPTTCSPTSSGCSAAAAMRSTRRPRAAARSRSPATTSCPRPQVQERLDGLTPAELRKLRDYEARHANRKTVLDKINRKLR